MHKSYISLAVVISPLLLCLVAGYGHVIVDLIAFIYPFQASIKAIRSPDKDDDTQWLIYWLVFAFIKVFEACFGWLLYHIPFYFLIKIIFTVWCYHAKTLGATKIYNVVIKPFIWQNRLQLLVDDVVEVPTESEITIFIERVDCVREYEEALCEITIEPSDATGTKSHHQRYETKHAEKGSTLIYNHALKLTLPLETIRNDYLQVIVRTQPAFAQVLEPKILGVVRHKLSDIGNFKLTEEGVFMIYGNIEQRTESKKDK